jgi:hypothetical protein
MISPSLLALLGVMLGTLRPTEHSMCTMPPPPAMALVRVEQDTTLPFAQAPFEIASASGVRPAADTLLAVAGTPMPAARVTLLELDTASLRVVSGGDGNPARRVAYLRAAPYRADCRTVRWTDTVPFVVRGETGFVRASIAPAEQWINGHPVLVVYDSWNYPYPRRRGLALRVDPAAPLASAEAMYSLSTALSTRSRYPMDSAAREPALAWAKANPLQAELEPVRTTLRMAILSSDRAAAWRMPSRLRGTYRVDMAAEGQQTTWFFRTHDLPGSMWSKPDSPQTIRGLLSSPHIPGYVLVGYAAGSRDSIPASMPRGPQRLPMAWLGSTDRPTTPGNETRNLLDGMLEFTLSATPESWWDVLEPLVPRPSYIDSLMMARMRFTTPRRQKQPRIPLVIRMEANGRVRADTTLVTDGRSLRIILERVDTLANRRGY